MKAVVRLCCSAVVVLLLSSLAFSQSLTTGGINGTILDSSGAAIPGATVVATNTKTGAQRTTTSGGTGLFVLAQLDPGEYTLTAQAQGFKTGQSGVVTVSVSRVASFHFRLQVGAASERVEVSSRAPLIEPSNPNTNLTLSATELGNVPNPGSDLAYAANFAPGVVLATATSAGAITTGSFEANGLPSIANDFTIDGLDANDPVSNVNVTGASGLQLGLNAVQEVSVNTLAYSVDQGRLGASQLNYVTKSGTNGFHGNAFEIWSGSAMNARNFFLNAFGEQRKPRSNVNQFGTSVGGPLVKDKVFFFADVEGIRLVLPVVLTSTLPSPAFQDYVLQQLPLGGTDSFGFPLPPQPQEVPFYQNMFSLMGDTSRGIALEMFGCPFDVGGVTPPAIPNDGNGCANKRTFSASPGASETLFTFKLDYNHSAKDAFWLRFQINNGKQRTSVDPVNSLFDAGATVPIRSSAAGWTRVFSPHLVNQFNPGFTYRAFRQDLADPDKARAALPIQLSPAGFSTIGNNLSFTPAGSATTIWQLTDNLAWTRGRHSATFGTNFRRVLVTHQNSLVQVPIVSQFSLEEFIFGAAAFSLQFFPVKTEDRERWANLDVYAMDTVRVTDKVTLSAGLRATWNSNLASADKLFSRLRGSFSTISYDVNRPLNLDIDSRQGTFFPATRLIQWAPRVGVAYELRPKTVLRAGAGFFLQPPEGALTSNLLTNAPALTSFSGGLFFPNVGGVGIAPGVPNSAVDVLAVANQQFQAAYSSGGLSCASPNAPPPPNCVPPVNYTVFNPGSHDQWLYPYSIQWSGGVERQLGNNFGLTVKYVGTHSVRGLYTDNPNAYQFACPGCFSPLPFGNAPDPRFSRVLAFHPGANSSYHSLQTTVQKRMSRGLSFQANYTYSHCIDTQSNFGDLLFNLGAGNGAALGSLATQRGNCDYDIRHSLNGFYLYELPFRSHRAWLNSIVGGWELSGSVFLRGGFPFTVRSFPSAEFNNAGFAINADRIAGQNPYAKGNVPGAGIQWLNPNAFQSTIDPNTFACFPVDSPQNCRDGNSGRNTLRGPDFRWSDFSIGKRVSIHEKLTFRLDAQFYNLFNHPNFGFPQSTIGFGNFGVISTTVSPSTGLLGANLGGDTSGRMISLRARIEF